MKKQTKNELQQQIQDVLPPKRIYNWQQSQLSVARHFGGCKVNGIEYIIRYDIEGQPLEEVKPAKKRVKLKSKNPRDENQNELL